MKRLLLIFSTLFLIDSLQSQVSYYSVINSISIVNGTSDCYMINYTVWHNNSTVHSTLDDVNIGSRNTIVGTDCPQPPPTEDFGNTIEHANFIQGINGEITIFPNPVSNFLTLSFPANSSKARNWKWHINSLLEGNVMTGRFDGIGDLIIQITSLNIGRYSIILIDDNNEIHTSNFTILR